VRERIRLPVVAWMPDATDPLKRRRYFSTNARSNT
jgi:hypothetical protein